MPDEFAQQLSELDFVVVEGTDCSLGPMLRETGEEMLEVEGFHFRGRGVRGVGGERERVGWMRYLL